MRWWSKAAMAAVLMFLASGCPKSTVSLDDAKGPDITCQPKCDGKECGDDGCSGSCGECPADSGISCSGAGLCVSIWPPKEVVGQDVAMAYEVVIPPDAGPAKICASLETQYEELLAGAAGCEGVLDCNHQVENRMQCMCTTYVAAGAVEPKLAAVVAAFKEHGCEEDVLCEPCGFLELPKCLDGVCVAHEPPCDALESLYDAAHKAARQCDDDEQCSSEQPISLECQCPQPVNQEAWGGFFEMAVEYWQIKSCPLPVPCDCAQGEGACYQGECVVAGEIPAGSVDCEKGSECQSVSGCSCGCWSEPPPDENPDVCPCAGPESCVCFNQHCTAPQEGSRACTTAADCFPLGWCHCDCFSQMPVFNNGTDAPMCDCEAPPDCGCVEGLCQGAW